MTVRNLGSSRCFCAGLAVALVLPSSATADAVASFDQTVTAEIQPQVGRLLQRLAQSGRAMKLDGVAVFNGDAKFLPGKIALSLADILTSLTKGDPRVPDYLADFRKLAKLTVDDTNEAWEIYYYLSALNRLRKAGEIDQAIDAETFAKFRRRLDWRTFVKIGDLTLIDLPNNYYVVAFGVARLRAAMGGRMAPAQ